MHTNYILNSFRQIYMPRLYQNEMNGTVTATTYHFGLNFVVSINNEICSNNKIQYLFTFRLFVLHFAETIRSIYLFIYFMILLLSNVCMCVSMCRISSFVYFEFTRPCSMLTIFLTLPTQKEMSNRNSQFKKKHYARMR